MTRLRPSALVLYIDSSYINDKVGTSAMIADSSIIYWLYLGRVSEAMVYIAELRGILSVLQIVYKKDYKAVIVVIRSVANPDMVIRTVYNSLLLAEWKEVWMNEKTGICLEPTTKVLLLYKSVPRLFSLLIIAKIGLRQFLSLRKVPDMDDNKERIRDQQDLRKVLGVPASVLKAAKFMRNTGLLGQFEAIL
ncbi:Ribonuclease H protein [Rutstroemia sp. NJR-2017a WRK4]|nr:Ribonuclease H protein [Rutstroemia sp. NJR-2017a WRK4]